MLLVFGFVAPLAAVCDVVGEVVNDDGLGHIYRREARLGSRSTFV